MAKKEYKKSAKPKYTATEKRAYWIGVGFHSGSESGLGMRSDSVTFLMNDKEKASFLNGRFMADDLSAKFVPEYVVKSTSKNARTEKRNKPQKNNRPR